MCLNDCSPIYPTEFACVPLCTVQLLSTAARTGAPRGQVSSCASQSRTGKYNPGNQSFKFWCLTDFAGFSVLVVFSTHSLGPLRRLAPHPRAASGVCATVVTTVTTSSLCVGDCLSFSSPISKINFQKLEITFGENNIFLPCTKADKKQIKK